jgi:hypothetical protein
MRGLNDIHPVESFFGRLASLSSYPDGVVPMSARLEGIHFFPGGAGLAGVVPGQPLPPLPRGGVMVVGHNFYHEPGFRALLARGATEPASATWRNLVRLLDESDIPLDRCFFTNAFVGLIAGARPTGRFPGAADPAFVEWCLSFLREQLIMMQPSVVVALGTPVRRMLARLSPSLAAAWPGAARLRDLDARGAGLVYPAVFDGVARPAAAVALTHPAMRHASVARRRYRSLSGAVVEVHMLREAVRFGTT